MMLDFPGLKTWALLGDPPPRDPELIRGSSNFGLGHGTKAVSKIAAAVRIQAVAHV